MAQAHWGTRALRENLDETVEDPELPQAFPAQRPADFMGRLRVRLRAEGQAVVAYGYGGQRTEMPSSEIGAVRMVRAYRTGSTTRGQALLVFDKHDRILLRAGGLWDTYGEVARVCRAAGAPSPEHVRYPQAVTVTRSMSASKRHQAQHARRRPKPPLYQKADGYRKLRTVPRGTTLRVLGVTAALLVTTGLCGLAGVLPAVLLPDWIGSVRMLIAVAGVALGVAGGIWLFAALTHVAADGVRWAAASLGAMTPAPPGRFFRRRGSSKKWADLATAGMIALVPALIGWGPAVALVTGVHGVSDSQLVADLRASGARTPGFLIDVPDYETDDNGNTTVTDVPTLSFRMGGVRWQDTDPSIGGRPLALDSSDPIDTHRPVTVVYDPSDPYTAAALPQITGSVWHGAPTANVIVGIIFTLALPFLTWRLVVRVRRRKWLRDADMVDDFFGAG